MKTYCFLISLFFIFLCSPLHAGLPIRAQKSDPVTVSAQSHGKTYRIQFFSLKRRNSIAPALLVLLDNGKAELTIEREEITTTKCEYSIDNFSFEANWEFTVKKNRQYCYDAKFKGLYLQDNYILGIMTLQEHIEPNILTQKIPFLFWGPFSADQQGKKKDKK